jgi:hypothetical protein
MMNWEADTLPSIALVISLPNLPLMEWSNLIIWPTVVLRLSSARSKDSGIYIYLPKLISAKVEHFGTRKVK